VCVCVVCGVCGVCGFFILRVCLQCLFLKLEYE